MKKSHNIVNKIQNKRCNLLLSPSTKASNPRGHSNTSVVHMRDQRNVKKGLFLFFV